MKCYDNVLEVVNRAKEEFFRGFVLDKNRLNGLKTVCDSFDKFAAVADAKYIDIEVDESNGALMISIDVPDLVIRDESTLVFYEITAASDGFAFEKNRGDSVCFVAWFAGLWAKA